MKYAVTRDQAQDYNLGDLTIVVWEGEGLLDKLTMDSNGMWEAPGVGSAALNNELTPESFEKEYGIVPPKAGSKNVLVAEYRWE